MDNRMDPHERYRKMSYKSLIALRSDNRGLYSEA